VTARHHVLLSGSNRRLFVDLEAAIAKSAQRQLGSARAGSLSSLVSCKTLGRHRSTAIDCQTYDREQCNR